MTGGALVSLHFSSPHTVRVPHPCRRPYRRHGWERGCPGRAPRPETFIFYPLDTPLTIEAATEDRAAASRALLPGPVPVSERGNSLNL
jgi:hypothetical protein